MQSSANIRLANGIKRFTTALFRDVLLVAISVIILYPLLYMITISLRPIEEIWDPSVVWISKSLTLDNMIKTIDFMDYWSVLWRSVRLTVVSSLLTVVSCSLAGYGFARFRFKGRELLFMCVLFTIMVPAETIIIPSYTQFWQFDFFGLGYLLYPFLGEPLTANLLNTELTLYIPALFGSGIRAGLFIYLFRQYYRGLPKELEEAASIDGCNAFTTYLRIAVPSSRLTMVTVFLFSSIWYWNDYYFTNMYMNNARTVSSTLAALPSMLNAILNGLSETLQGFDQVQISTMIQSGCLLLIIPPLILFAFCQRYFVQGLELSGLVE
ncbi:MAG: carbohydrate ABC transporter permease [Clostridia bacterium]|nr:carbohydrate ABC transporter permease [Clostridia bacterium]